MLEISDFLGCLWQIPFNLCQSWKIFCNSSPQVVKLSLFFYKKIFFLYDFSQYKENLWNACF